jgi:DNA-binding transcriptional MocR family regulator
MAEMKSFTGAATLLGLRLFVPHTGFFCYLTLPKELSSNRLVELLKINQISVAGTQDMFLPCFFKDNSFRISLCSLEKNAVSQSLQLTFRCIEKAMNSAKKSLPHEDMYIQ